MKTRTAEDAETKIHEIPHIQVRNVLIFWIIDLDFFNLFYLFSSKRKLCQQQQQCTDRHGRYECQH